jgi:hypothetical protein
VLGGIIWRRANRWGALASLLSALATNFILYSATGQRLDHWDPNVFLAALAVGIAALVVVSLVTPPEPAAPVRDLFDRLERSSDGEATPEAAAQSPRQPLLLVDLLHLRGGERGGLWKTYREDLSGFAIAWLIVLILVAATGFYLQS